MTVEKVPYRALSVLIPSEIKKVIFKVKGHEERLSFADIGKGEKKSAMSPIYVK
jgi:hypothetical protein